MKELPVVTTLCCFRTLFCTYFIILSFCLACVLPRGHFQHLHFLTLKTCCHPKDSIDSYTNFCCRVYTSMSCLLSWFWVSHLIGPFYIYIYIIEASFSFLVLCFHLSHVHNVLKQFYIASELPYETCRYSIHNHCTIKQLESNLFF